MNAVSELRIAPLWAKLFFIRDSSQTVRDSTLPVLRRKTMLGEVHKELPKKHHEAGPPEQMPTDAL